MAKKKSRRVVLTDCDEELEELENVRKQKLIRRDPRRQQPQNERTKVEDKRRQNGL